MEIRKSVGLEGRDDDVRLGEAGLAHRRVEEVGVLRRIALDLRLQRAVRRHGREHLVEKRDAEIGGERAALAPGPGEAGGVEAEGGDLVRSEVGDGLVAARVAAQLAFGVEADHLPGAGVVEVGLAPRRAGRPGASEGLDSVLRDEGVPQAAVGYVANGNGRHGKGRDHDGNADEGEWARRGSNPHAFPHQNLNLACLPFHHLPGDAPIVA